MSSPLIPGQHRRLRWRLQRVAAGNPQDRGAPQTAPYTDGSRTEAAGANWGSKEGGQDFDAVYGRVRVHVEREAG